MRWILPALFLVACEPQVPVDTDITAPLPGTPPPTTDPLPDYDDEGSIVLLHRYPEVDDSDDYIYLAGIFAVSTFDYVNLASCLAFREDGSYCAELLPENRDTWVDVEKYTDDILGPLEPLDIGNSFRLGPYLANGGDFQGLRVYFNSALEPFGMPVDGDLSLSFDGGEWGAYEEEDVVPAPDPMVVTYPDPLRRHTLSNGLFEFTWVPGLVGDVYLTVRTDTVDRLFKLEDDGQHFLDVDELGLTDLEEVEITLGRWTHVTHELYGNEIDILVQDEQIIRGQYRDLSNRVELVGEDTCAAAQYAPLLTSGQFFGRLSTNNNELVPSGTCGNDGNGPEQILKAELNDGGEINVAYRIFNNDAALYMMTSCGNMGTCLLGSDTTFNDGIENLSWVNDLGGPTDLYVVLDSSNGPINDLYLLDVDIIDIFASPLVDQCADALYQTPLTSFPPGTDRYVGDITPFSNYADPAGACGITGPGGDGMVKVELGPNETVQATVEMPGADPVVYLLYNCAISASCASGSDYDTTEIETVSYTNTTASTEVLYLVVDSQGGSGSYTLDLLIQ